MERILKDSEGNSLKRLAALVEAIS